MTRAEPGTRPIQLALLIRGRQLIKARSKGVVFTDRSPKIVIGFRELEIRLATAAGAIQPFCRSQGTSRILACAERPLLHLDHAAGMSELVQDHRLQNRRPESFGNVTG